MNAALKATLALFLAAQVLVSSLLPSFGVDQSARLVDLVQHFREHRQTDPALGFLAFMEMHYGANSEHQKHPNHSHHNLPASGHSISAFTPAPLSLLQLASRPVLMLSRAVCFGYTNLYSFLSIRSLINPPRR